MHGRGRSDQVAARIVEVEAYRGAEDPASHAYRGETPRNGPCSGHPATCTSTSPTGCTGAPTSWAATTVSPSAVLVRARRAIVGLDHMRARRGPTDPDRRLCAGPACLTQALGIGVRTMGTTWSAGRSGSSTTAYRRRDARSDRRGSAWPGAGGEPSVALVRRGRRQRQPGRPRPCYTPPSRRHRPLLGSFDGRRGSEQLRVLSAGAVDVITDADLGRKLNEGRRCGSSSGSTRRHPTSTSGSPSCCASCASSRTWVTSRSSSSATSPRRSATLLGRSTTRPPLSAAEIERHAEHLHRPGVAHPLTEPLEVRRNSEWLARWGSRTSCASRARTTVARMLERDDFASRYRDGRPISLSEFLYPLLQGWDSVVVARGRRARRHRPALQQPHGTDAPGTRGPRGPGRAHHADPRGPRRRAEDVEVAWQLRRDHGATGGAVRQGHVGAGRAHAALLRAHDRLGPGRVADVTRQSAPRRSSARSTPSACWPARSSACTTAIPRRRAPRPSSIGCSVITQTPTDVPE